MKIYESGKCIFINKYFKNNNGLEINIIGKYNSYTIIINNDINSSSFIKNKGTAEENFKIAYDIVNEKYGNLTYITDKEKILEYINEIQEPSTARNRMGCSESWYDPFYAMKQTFTKEEIEAMSDDEINNLFRLASSIQEGLY